MTDLPEQAPTRGRSGSARIWLVAGLVLALGATAALVLSDDTRWLRVGIVAALWAALLAGVVASSHRRRADVASESSEQAQRIYELELEKEIAARREYELEIEKRVRSEVEEQSRSDVEALRSELTGLRETLEQLFGAEVTYERVALTAQATRMRSLNKKYSPSSAFAAIRGRAEALSSDDRFSDEPTQLISRVLDDDDAGFSYSTQPTKTEPEKSAKKAKAARKPAADASTAKDPDDNTAADAPKAKDPDDKAHPSKPAKPKSKKAKKKSEPVTAKVSAHEEKSAGTLDFPGPDEGTPEEHAVEPAASQTGTETDWTPSWERGKHDAEPADGQATAVATEPPPEAAAEQPRRRHRADLPLDDAPSGRHSSGSEQDDDAPSGSHSSGRSVSELLASLGSSASPRRHRRRG